jgi:hypothetical protein
MTPQEAYFKCRDNNKIDKRLEPIIIKSLQYAYKYARDVIKGRWKEAEPIIIKNSCYAYRYARDVIKGKLPENMHNAMILHRINEDSWAKYYFDFIKS